MTAFLIQLGAWLGKKLLIGLFIVLAGLGCYSLYLYVQENLEIEVQRVELLEKLKEERAALVELAEKTEQEVSMVREDLKTAQQKAEIAQRLMTSLQEIQSFWDWLFADPEEEKKLKERMAYAQGVRAEQLANIEVFETRLHELVANAGLNQSRLVEVESDLSELEKGPSPLIYYGEKAWEKIRVPLLIALFVFFFGPTIWSLLCYYGLAGWLSHCRSIELIEGKQPAISVTASRVSEDVLLAPGETVWVKEKFLQASDEGLQRKTRFVLDWRIPFTSVACGLIELIEMRNAKEEDKLSVTFSTQAEPTTELAIVSIPEEGSLILRPHFLAGIVVPDEGMMQIRRHWRLFSLQAWITLQFRFFEFVGPGRLIVAGSRGVRGELLSEGSAEKGRRTNQDSTIGFMPSLSYRSVRAETFWAYFRGKNPLFDDLFQGEGTFLCQEIAVKGEAATARRFWAQLWQGFTKIFGM